MIAHRSTQSLERTFAICFLAVICHDVAYARKQMEIIGVVRCFQMEGRAAAASA
jgi:hypothetical protein